MLPKSFALSDDDEESDCSIPRDDFEPVQTIPNDCPVVINEYSSTPIEVPNICWHGYSNFPKSLTVTNTGESVQITGKWGRGRPYVTGGPLNGSYLFSQIHFHWPSEHMLNEKRYPLEMHAVHYKAAYLTQERAMKENDGTVVLVYLFEIGPGNTTDMYKLTKHLSEIKQKNYKIEIDDSSLEDFVKPFVSNYFVYWGSAEIGESCYSLQWIISCSKLPISHSEYCDLKELFCDGEDGGRARKFKRDAKPTAKDIFLVGDTIGRTISEAHRSEVRFSDVDRSSASAEKSKSCCFLAKYRRSNSNSPRGQDCSSNKSAEQIYSGPSSSQCSLESSPCSRTVHDSTKSCTDKNSQTPVNDPCNMNTQTSSKSICTCSTAKSNQRGSCELKSKCSDLYTCEDPVSRVTSSKDDETYTKWKKKVLKCFVKSNEIHDCVDNGCENQVCSTDCDRNSSEWKRSNKSKETKKEKNSRPKYRQYSKDSSSSGDEIDAAARCSSSCEMKETKKNDEETCHLVKYKTECPDDEDGKGKKKKKSKEKPQKTEEVVQSGDPPEEPPEETPPKKIKEVAKAKKRHESVGAKKGEEKAKFRFPSGVEYQVKESKKTGGKEAAEDVESEGATKQMGQHKPIILAPATVDENTYVLKSVGTMTPISLYPAHIEGISLAGEGGEALLSGSTISRSHIWKRERKIPIKDQKTMDKISGIPECEETKDLEMIPSNLCNQRELAAPKERLQNKTTLTGEIDSVTMQQSLASLLAKISKDQSLGNILSQFSGQIAQSSDGDKVETEPPLGSILARISKDPSLACILTKISRDASLGRVSEGPSGVKIETEPSNVKEVPKSSTEKISREPSAAALWAKLKTRNSELDKSSKEPSPSSVLAKLSRDMSTSNDMNKPVKDPTATADPAKSSKEQALSIIAGGVSRDRKLASKQSSLTSILYKISKKSTLSTAAAKPSKHQSTNAFDNCKDVAVPKVVTLPTNEVPDMLSKSCKQPTSQETTKEQSLVSVLVRVSKEPSLARDLANLLKQEPLSEEITKSMRQSFASVLARISKEPSLASDLANILKKESVAEDVGMEPVTTPSKAGVAKLLTKTTEESLANILVTVSQEPSLAADLAKCSKHQSLASILTKVSKASSLAVDVANVLYHNTARSATEDSLASIFTSKPKLVADAVKYSNELSMADLSTKAFNSPSSLVSDSVNTPAKESADVGMKQPRMEQSLASVLVKVSKEPSLAADLVNVLKNASETSELTKKAKEQSLSNFIEKASVDALASDMANTSKHESRTSHSDKPGVEESLANILAAVYNEPEAKCTNEQSLASILGRISKKPSLALDVANILKQESSIERLVKPDEDKPLTYDLATVAKDSPVMVDLASVPQEAFLLGELAEAQKKESLGTILGRLSRDPSHANEVAKSVIKASLAEILPAAGTKKSTQSREISEHAINQSLANILNKVTREPSLANDIINTFAKESLAEIFFAVAKQPSLASDISRHSKNQSLINAMGLVSREPSLAKDLADSVAEDAVGDILSAVTKNPSLASEIRKHSKTTSLLNIVNRVSREPSLADDIAKSIMEDTVIEILLAITQDPSLARNISKHSRNRSLNNVLDKVSEEPSLASDLANTAKCPGNQSLINILDRISREQSWTTNLVDTLKEELLTDDPSQSAKGEPWRSSLTKNRKASSMSCMKPKIAGEASTVSDIKHQSLASILDRIPIVPSSCASSAKSAAEQTLAKILASLVGERSSTADLEGLRQKSLVDILLKFSRDPSFASDLANITKKMSKEVPAPPHSAEEVYLTDILIGRQPPRAEDPIECDTDNSSAKVPATASNETSLPSYSAVFPIGNATSNNGEPVADTSLPREEQLPVNSVTPLADQSLANISETESTKSIATVDLRNSSASSVHSEITKSQTSGEILTRSGKDPSSPTDPLNTSAEQVEAVNATSRTVIPVRMESSRAEDSASPSERATILKSTRSYMVTGEVVVNTRSQTQEQEKTRVNFEAEPIHQSFIDTERPEVEKLHRQEDLNESIKSRRSTDTRRSGDDEMSLDSYRKKIMVSPEESQLYSKAEEEVKHMQPFEEYYVRVENENSVLQEYTGKIGSSELISGNSVKLRLLPKTSIPIDDLNLEMEDCIIRFDSKEKAEELYMEAHFLVGKSGKSIQSLGPSLRALEITDCAVTASENSLLRKKTLYFKSEGIQMDRKTGKKILIGHFTQDNNCKFALDVFTQ